MMMTPALRRRMVSERLILLVEEVVAPGLAHPFASVLVMVLEVSNFTGISWFLKSSTYHSNIFLFWYSSSNVLQILHGICISELMSVTKICDIM